MRVLFSSVYPHLPDVIGGLQTTTDDLCTALVNVGAQAAVLCGQNEHDTTGHALPRRDDTLGYPVFRVADPIHDLPLLAASWEPQHHCGSKWHHTIAHGDQCAGYRPAHRRLPAQRGNPPTGRNPGTGRVSCIWPIPNLLPNAGTHCVGSIAWWYLRWCCLSATSCPNGANRYFSVNPTQIKGVEIMHLSRWRPLARTSLFWYQKVGGSTPTRATIVCSVRAGCPNSQ